MKDSGLAPGSVDIVVMSDSIYYLPDILGTLQEVHSYMRPTGELFMRQPTRAGLIHILLMVNRQKALSSRIWGGHVHEFSRRSTKLALKQAGFADVRFLKEKGFKHSLKGEVLHRILRATDFVTLHSLDLTPSWIIIAKPGENPHSCIDREHIYS